MKLFVGGAFQGKRDCMQGMFGIEESVIADGAQELKEIAAIDHYHLRIRKQLETGLDPVEELEKLLNKHPDIVLLCDEVGQGIVPMERADRDYREAVGRTMCVAAQRAEEVYRVVCGLAQRIK